MKIILPFIHNNGLLLRLGLQSDRVVLSCFLARSLNLSFVIVFTVTGL